MPYDKKEPKRPDPGILGTGMAQQAAEAIKKRNERMDQLIKQTSGTTKPKKLKYK